MGEGYKIYPQLKNLYTYTKTKNKEEHKNGKIGIGNAGKYQSSGNGGYFSLKDDGDSAVVRFLYNQPDGSDIDYF